MTAEARRESCSAVIDRRYRIPFGLNVIPRDQEVSRAVTVAATLSDSRPFAFLRGQNCPFLLSCLFVCCLMSLRSVRKQQSEVFICAHPRYLR